MQDQSKLHQSSGLYMHTSTRQSQSVHHQGSILGEQNFDSSNLMMQEEDLEKVQLNLFYESIKQIYKSSKLAQAQDLNQSHMSQF